MLLHIDAGRARVVFGGVALGHLVQDALNVAQLRARQIRLLVIR